MKAHLSLVVIRQRKHFIAPPRPLRSGCQRQGERVGEGKREAYNEERRSGHWCGPE